MGLVDMLFDIASFNGIERFLVTNGFKIAGGKAKAITKVNHDLNGGNT